MAKPLPSWPSTRLDSWTTDSWAWELFSCSISIVATVAVGIVLLVYDDKAIPKLRYDIGLNTIVSILGTISKSALLLCVASSIGQFRWLSFYHPSRPRSLLDVQLYDEASRGPWGSMFLISSDPKVSWAKLGALVTIFSLAFDPMFQLLIRFEQREVYQSSTSATVKRAEIFMDPSSSLLGTVNGDDGLSSDWSLAVTNAILTENSDLEVKPSCPAGNCTFPTFSTLGFCSNCADATKYLQQHSKCTPANSTTSTAKCSYELPLAGNGLKYPISQGIHDIPSAIVNGTLNLSWQDFGPTLQGAPAFLTLLLSNPVESNLTDAPAGYQEHQIPFRSDTAGVIPSSLSTFAIFKMASSKGSGSTGSIETAHICAFSLCARKYNVTVQSGVSNINVLSTSYSALSTHNDSAKPGDSESSSYTFLNGTESFTFSPASIPAPSSLGPVAFEDGFSLSLGKILAGNVTFDKFPKHTFPHSTNVLQAGLNASSNIPRTMDRIALAMTTHLRDISNLIVFGQASFMETYIHVEWSWFTLPALSVLLGLSTLVVAIVQTRRHRLHIWKNSELALLFHHLDLDSALEIRKVSEMEKIAIELNVKLEEGHRGGFSLRRRP